MTGLENESARRSLEKLIGPVSRETWHDLETFVTHFRHWSTAINLAGPKSLDHLWERHILDSAQLIPLGKHATRWSDLGSGGGFPGLVVAILQKAQGAGTTQLVESNRKKAAFLQSVVGELRLPARVTARRIEEIVQEGPAPQVVTARALAPLNRLLELTEPWLSGVTTALFHKGRDYQREIEESAEKWKFDLLEHPSVVADDSIILEISNLRPRS